MGGMLRCAVVAFVAIAAAVAETILSSGFTDGLDGWVHSTDSKYMGRFVVEEAKSVDGDMELMIPEKAMHYAIATRAEVDPSQHEELVIQYEVKYEMGVSCSGSYIKLLLAPFEDLGDLKDGVPYSIMFGPDKCGSNDRVHFIFQFKDQNTGEYREHHLLRPPSIAGPNTKTHLYTLILRGEEFDIQVDGETKRKGLLSGDDEFSPPLNPPAEVEDPDDKKPDDWVDEEMIPDPDAKKPEDWDESATLTIPDPKATAPEGWLEDEPLTIPDPEAVKPEDWDDEEDGEWEPAEIENPKCEVGCGPWKAPMVPNPAYKGKWTPPNIKNPNYVGEWKPRLIENPLYYEVTKPRLLPFSALGLELWVMDPRIRFDNFFISTSVAEASAYTESTWGLKVKAETAEEAKNSPVEKTALTKFLAYCDEIDGLVAGRLQELGLEETVNFVRSVPVDYPFFVILFVLSISPILGTVLYWILRKVTGRTEAAGEEPASSEAAQVDPATAKKEDTETTDDKAPAGEVAEESEIKPEPEDSTLRQRNVAGNSSSN